MAGGVEWRTEFNHYPKIAAGMAREADRIVARTALELEGQMKLRAPVLTGFLRGSIQATRQGHAHWLVVVGADYGIYQEYGTVHTAAQPYFHPAVRVVRPRWNAAMRDLVAGGAR